MDDDLHTYWKGLAQPQFSRVLRPEHRGGHIALDFDNTCIAGDTGALFHLWLSRNLAWNLDAFADQVAPEDGQEHLRTLIAGYRRGDDCRTALFEELMVGFPRRFHRLGEREAHAWASRLQIGQERAVLQGYAYQMLLQEAREARRVETIPIRGAQPLEVERGIRSRPALAALVQRAGALGIQVWIISATNEWTVSVAARDFGVPEARVIGNRHTVSDGIIQRERTAPITVREGKVEAYKTLISADTAPLLGIGDSWSDYPLMCHSQEAILIDRGDVELREAAHTRGWAIVPESIFETVPWGTLRANS